MIAHNKPCLDKKDSLKANQVVNSNWVAYGKECHKLEKKLSTFILNSKKNSIVCSSGTSALFLALYALGVKKGDEVLLSTYTCSAVINAIYLLKAKPILVDINLENLAICHQLIKEKITTKTKAIIIVHIYGIPCEIDPFKEFKIPIIEDCSQSLGTRFKDGTMTGSKGDIATFSFYATKMITGGYGGAVLSKDIKYISRITDYINFDQPKSYYPRFNFLLSDINASIINSQFNRIEKILHTRKMIAKRYKKVINKKWLKYSSINGQNYFRFILFFKNKKELTKIYNQLLNNDINVINPLTQNELLNNYLNKKGFKIAKKMSNILLSIPIYPCLKTKEIEHIINTLKELK